MVNDLILEEKRKKEKENRKNTILKAARKLFFERGFKSVTVDDIASKSEVSKGSIYLCFESKEEIYAQILIGDNLALYKRLQNFSTTEATASQLLLEYSRIYVNFFLDDTELFRILMTFMLQTGQMNLTEKQNAELILSTNQNSNIISEIIQKGLASGEFSPIDNIWRMQNAIWGMLNGIISLYLFTGNPIKRTERIHATVKQGVSVVINGLKA
ncbi:transcriptional regulator, tetr family [hydrocarbon metagenome]|uniref:Transcriptional regulator, tetr family n=1 Tax=hydrocarbon metagenome TaxID=938273 RepID=A0A0W8FKH9_9ZZZZ